MTVAATKIEPPRLRPDLLPRPALEARLAASLGAHRLVLVCAPAGYGKSSLLAQLARRPDATGPLAWVSCDEDDDAARFLSALLAALEPLDLPWRVQPEALADRLARPAGRAAVTDHLVNAMAGADLRRATLVLDDLHRLHDEALLALLDALLERLPAGWTVVAAARSDPPLSLARLRARGELAEFGRADLGFSVDETAALVGRLGPAAPAQADAEALHARTHGWPAGLRLALTVLQRSPGAAWPAVAPTVERQMFDFLVSEVLDRLPPRLRDFLVATAPLPELTAARGAALSGDADAARHLQDVERLGLAVAPADPATGSLRLHDLFREALERRLALQGPAHLRETLRRAADTEPDPLRQVGWLLRAEDWEAAERRLAEIADDQVADGAGAAVLALCQRFPADWAASSPRLPLLSARLRWNWDQAADAAERAARMLADRGEAAEARLVRVHRAAALAGANRAGEARAVIAGLGADAGLQGEARAHVLRTQAWLAFAEGDTRAAAPIWHELLDVLARSRSLALWTACVPLPGFVGLPGMGPLLRRFVEGAQARLPEATTPLRAACMLIDACLRLWAGEVEAAEALAAAAADDNRWLARPPGLDAPTRTVGALLAALRGDMAAVDGMRALLRDVGDVSEVGSVGSGGPRFRAEVYLGLYEHLTLRWAALAGDEATVKEMAARQIARPVEGRGLRSQARRDTAAALLALAAGDAEAACRHWEALLTSPRPGDLYGLLAEARLALADARLAVGRPATHAADALEPLWVSLDADGDGVLLLAGPARLARLSTAPWGAALAPARLARLARAEAQARALRAGGRARASAAAPAGLSPREREVLARLAAGDSNKLIARALDLSPHTVKRHVANILDKLAVGSRGQAAAWWQAQARR